MKNPNYTAIETTWRLVVGSAITGLQVYLTAMLLVIPTFEMPYMPLELNQGWQKSVVEFCKTTPNCAKVAIEQGLVAAPIPERPWQWPGGSLTVVKVYAKGPSAPVIEAFAKQFPSKMKQVAFRDGGKGGSQ